MIQYSKEFLENLYKTMLKIRLCEESLVVPITKGEVKCPCHLCSGQEAIAVGVCANLDKDDYVFGTHRSHGHYIAKGGEMSELIAEIYGKETGCSHGRGGSMHLIDIEKGVMGAAPIVAGTIALAVGAALACKIKKENRVAVSFFGDGATGEGVLYEALNFASLKKLPILFACENNYYSTHMPIGECRPSDNIYKIGIPFCLASWRVDGNDVLKVYDATRKAVEICKKGDGPVFIEFMTYRLRGHVGPDDNIQGTHTDIRPIEEIERWNKKDPILRFKKFLVKNKVFSKDDLQSIQKELETEIDNAYVFAKNSPYPEKDELKKYVFKE